MSIIRGREIGDGWYEILDEYQYKAMFAKHRVMSCKLSEKKTDSGLTEWRAIMEVALPDYGKYYRCRSVMTYYIDMDAYGYFAGVDTADYDQPTPTDELVEKLSARIRKKIQAEYPEIVATQWSDEVEE